MKKILIVCLFISNYCFSQLPTKDGQVFYEKIDTCNLSKEQLYSITKLWFANTFKDSKSVIQIYDKENGQIVGKGNFRINYNYSLYSFSPFINFTIKINLKNNKYKMQLYNFIMEPERTDLQYAVENLSKELGKSVNKKVTPLIDEKAKSLLTNFSDNIHNQDDDSF